MTAEKFWDPVGESVSANTFEKQNAKLHERLKQWQQNPLKLHRTRRLLWIVTWVLEAALACIIYLYFSDGGGDGRIFGLLVIPFSVIGVYIAYIRKLQGDLVCSLFAEKHQWVYNPDPSKPRWGKFSTAFPQLFNIGNWNSQYMEDEFWGSMIIDGERHEFWKGIFTFSQKEGKHSHTYTRDAMAFRLPKKFTAHLVLAPERFRLFGEGKDDVKTESMEFNRAFTISCPGMNDAKKHDIIRALSPAVQTRLMDLQQKKGAFSLALSGETIVFSFYSSITPLYHTDFFKKVDIDPRDEEVLQKNLREILSVTGEMLRYMD